MPKTETVITIQTAVVCFKFELTVYFCSSCSKDDMFCFQFAQPWHLVQPHSQHLPLLPPKFARNGGAEPPGEAPHAKRAVFCSFVVQIWDIWLFQVTTWKFRICDAVFFWRNNNLNTQIMGSKVTFSKRGPQRSSCASNRAVRWAGIWRSYQRISRVKLAGSAIFSHTISPIYAYFASIVNTVRWETTSIYSRIMKNQNSQMGLDITMFKCQRVLNCGNLTPRSRLRTATCPNFYTSSSSISKKVTTNDQKWIHICICFALQQVTAVATNLHLHSLTAHK